MQVGHFTSMAAGGESDILIIDRIIPISGGAIVSVRMSDSAYDQYVSVWVDGVQSGDAKWVSTNSVDFRCVCDSALTLHRVCVVPQGDWAQTDDFGEFVFSDFFAQCKNRIQATITPSLEFIPASDSQLSSVTLTGVERFKNCESVFGQVHWCKIKCAVSNSAGTRTVTLSANNVTVASGSRSGDGVVTLAEQNDSGVSGTATVTYTADITGKILWVRYPESYELHYKTSVFTAPDFPRTPEHAGADTGTETSHRILSGDLASGTYYVLARQQDDGNNVSTNLDSGGTAITIINPPASPSNVVYSSGGYAATIISFTASTTSGATYNIYDSGETGFLDVDVVAGTHIAGTGTITQTLSAVSSGFTGNRKILVRSVYAGVEDSNASILNIEYLSGVVVLPRPNNPALSRAHSAIGRQITVPLVYSTADQLVAPSTFALYLWIDGAAQSFATPTTTVSVGTLEGGKYMADIQYTAGSNGLYWYGVRAVSAAGATSDSIQILGPIELTNATPSGPLSTVIEGA